MSRRTLGDTIKSENINNNNYNNNDNNHLLLFMHQVENAQDIWIYSRELQDNNGVNST